MVGDAYGGGTDVEVAMLVIASVGCLDVELEFGVLN